MTWGEIGGILTITVVVVGAFNRYLLWNIQAELTGFIATLDRRYAAKEATEKEQSRLDEEILRNRDHVHDLVNQLAGAGLKVTGMSKKAVQ